MNSCALSYDLIVTIVSKGNAEDVVEYAKKAGAEGGTILTAAEPASTKPSKFSASPSSRKKK